MKENIVLWQCKICGYKWEGKSPSARANRPHCSQCGSGHVQVKNWFNDKKRWNETRLEVLKRDNWQCQKCGQKVDNSAHIHHKSYDDYYALDNLITLCNKCHYLLEKKPFAYLGFEMNNSGCLFFGIIIGLLIFISMLLGQAPILLSICFGVILGICTLLLFIKSAKKEHKTEETTNNNNSEFVK